MVRDETGNYVLQGSIAGQSDVGGRADAGGPTWRDYALEFRGRVLKNSSGWDLTARVRANPICNRYTVSFQAGESDGAQIHQQRTGGSGCQTHSKSSVNPLSLELNRWYSVRIEAVGPRITVYLDGQQILELRDDQPLLTGGINFTVKPGGTVQYDDIRVVNLAVAPEATPTPMPTLRPVAIPTADAYRGLGSNAGVARAFGEPFLQAVNKIPPDFRDDFVSNKGWRWDRCTDAQGTPKIQDGVLRISDLVGCIGASNRALERVPDFVLQVDMRMVQGDRSARHQVYLRKNRQYEYLLDVNSINGSWRVRKISPEEKTYIAEGVGGVSPLGQVTQMLAVISGDEAIIYLNGKPIFYVMDEHLISKSSIQIRCTTRTEGVCEFDNFRYWNAANLPILPTATTTPVPTAAPAPRPTPAYIPTPTLPPLPPGSGLTRGGSISGMVTDADTGLPVSGVNITARNEPGNTSTARGRTDSSGRYILLGLAPGRYSLQAKRREGDYIPVFYDNKIIGNDTDLIKLSESETIEGIDFELKLGVSVSGRITDAETGLPISNVEVHGGPLEWLWVSDTISDWNGYYTLRGVPEGEIQVKVSGRGEAYVEQLKTMSVSVVNPLVEVDFALARGATVSGKVTDVDTGLPIANQRVDAYNSLPDGPGAESSTNADGVYTLRGIAPGQYRIRPCCHGCCGRQDYILGFYKDQLTWENADLVTVSGSKPVEGIDITLKRGATISGRIRDGQTGLPISGMRVRAGLAVWPDITSTSSDSKGKYPLRGVPDGPIVVVVGGEGYVEQRKSLTITNGQDVTGVDF